MDPTRIVLLSALAAVLCGTIAACGALLAVRAARRRAKRDNGTLAVPGHWRHDADGDDGGGDGD